MTVRSPRLTAIPQELLAAATAEGRDDWLHSVPAIVARFAAAWSLTVDPPFQPGGQTAWVAPATTAGGEDVVLKVAWPHPEAEHEGAGLAVWAGQGAVKLYEVAELPDTMVLLLERCRPGWALTQLPEESQDRVIASLLARLWVDPPVGPPFRPLAEMCAHWADRFEAQRASQPAGRAKLDPAVADEGMALYRTLPTTADRQVLLCTDLHAGNVLASRREPWLAIDPKPYVGDPAYDVTQHLLNCPSRLHRDPARLASRMAVLAGLDPARVRQWLFARCVQESLEWPGLAEVARQLA